VTRAALGRSVDDAEKEAAEEAKAAEEPARGRSRAFWNEKPLEAMSEAEWESLCDGCGRCCLQKLEDEDTGRIYHTRVACHLLDPASCRCRDYPSRHARVADCLSVRPLTAQKLGWLPSSCAYRRLAEGRGLASWHPLVSGEADSARRAGISVADRVVSEHEVPTHELVRYLVTWEGEGEEER